MSISSKKVIFKNTLMLYFRQIFALFVSLYTVRVVLDVLGAEDYGIYQVVGGIVMFFTFLKGTMASATQRFFSYAIGERNINKLKNTFSVNLISYFFIGVLALVLLEVFVFWFIKQDLKVPEARYNAALLVYHLTVISFFFTIFSTPFTSLIMAHEDMHIYAYISVAESILKLLIVFLLMYLSGDKLELYALLVLLVSVIVCILYVWISLKKYKECQFRGFYWDRSIFKEIIGFTGWTLFGSFTTAGRNQGVIILINQFYNPIVVASVAIAKNISGQIQAFSANFNSSLYPPIIKSYAVNDLKTMFSLIFTGSKLTFFLLYIFGLPLFLNMDTLLALWLKEIPENAILFTRLALVEVLINSISFPIITAARAPGKMKVYELVLGAIQIGIFLFTWLFFILGYEAYIVFIIAILANLVMFFVRLIIVRYLISLPIKSFFYKVLIPVVIVVVVSVTPSYFFKILLPKDFVFSILSSIICFIFVSISVFIFGLDKEWRVKVSNWVMSKFFLKMKL